MTENNYREPNGKTDVSLAYSERDGNTGCARENTQINRWGHTHSETNYKVMPMLKPESFDLNSGRRVGLTDGSAHRAPAVSTHHIGAQPNGFAVTKEMNPVTFNMFPANRRRNINVSQIPAAYMLSNTLNNPLYGAQACYGVTAEEIRASADNHGYEPHGKVSSALKRQYFPPQASFTQSLRDEIQKCKNNKPFF